MNNDNFGGPVDEPMNDPMSSPEPMNQTPMDQPVQNYGQPVGQPVNPYAQRMGRPMRGYGQRSYGQPMQQGYGQMQQPIQGYGGMPVYEQPIDPYGSSMSNMRSGGGGGNGSKIAFVVGAMAVFILIFVGAMLLPGLLSKKGGGGDNGGGSNNDKLVTITLDMVSNYCEKKGYQAETRTDYDSDEVRMITCANKDATEMIAFEKDAGNTYDEEQLEELEDNGLRIIGKTANHFEMYAISKGMNYYIVSEDKSVFYIYTAEKDSIGTILDGVREGDSRNDDYKDLKDDEILDLDKMATDSLMRSQRDAARRNDMSRVNTSLVQYQTNHSSDNDNLPGPFSWRGSAEFESDTCDVIGPNNTKTINTACVFVRDYLNNLDDRVGENEFVDPDGTPYSVLITANWAIYGDLGDISFNEKIFLAPKGNGYAIDGNDYFKEHVIFIVPGGICSDGAVVKSTKRHFAVLYQLEGAGMYCMDDQ